MVTLSALVMASLSVVNNAIILIAETVMVGLNANSRVWANLEA